MPGRDDHPVGVRSHPTAVLAIILVSYLMIVLDISVVITALPRIREDLGFSTAGLSWVQSAYTLVFGGLLLLGARAGDIIGRRRVFILGLVLFTLASLVVGAAPSAVWLLAGRVLQGVGAAALAPSTLALLTASFPDGPERTRAVAAYGAVAGVGASVGLVLGGVLTGFLSWRYGFFINLPIGAAMLVAARRYLTETEHNPGRLDVFGALTSTLGMTALVYGFVRSAEAGWSDGLTVAAVISGAVLAVVFVLNEWRARQPIMPLRLFASRERSGAYLARLLFLGAMVGYFFFTTQFLQQVLGYTPLQAGLAFLPMTLVNFVVALAVPRLTRRFGNTTLLAAGIAVTVLGMAWLSRLDAGSPYLTAVALPMVLIGVGQGMAFGPLTAAGIAGVAPNDAGAASGLVNVAHQLGGSLGLGILVAVASTAGTDPGGADATLARHVATALTVGSVLLALALAAVLTLIARRTPALEPSLPQQPQLTLTTASTPDAQT
ncbi:MFS transporter [Phytohabitans rumicis]|uniref:MFS transporter n=1 Tax=Phytohabitans rumicis TaxID=1076125 RepID=UPI002483D06D|nr:MFS transporter [Phytohabitans rumicis]